MPDLTIFCVSLQTDFIKGDESKQIEIRPAALFESSVEQFQSAAQVIVEKD